MRALTWHGTHDVRYDDPLGVDTIAPHRLPLSQAPQAYSTFRDKEDGAVKILFTP